MLLVALVICALPSTEGQAWMSPWRPYQVVEPKDITPASTLAQLTVGQERLKRVWSRSRAHEYQVNWEGDLSLQLLARHATPAALGQLKQLVDLWVVKGWLQHRPGRYHASSFVVDRDCLKFYAVTLFATHKCALPKKCGVASTVSEQLTWYGTKMVYCFSFHPRVRPDLKQYFRYDFRDGFLFAGGTFFGEIGAVWRLRVADSPYFGQPVVMGALGGKGWLSTVSLLVSIEEQRFEIWPSRCVDDDLVEKDDGSYMFPDHITRTVTATSVCLRYTRVTEVGQYGTCSRPLSVGESLFDALYGLGFPYPVECAGFKCPQIGTLRGSSSNVTLLAGGRALLTCSGVAGVSVLGGDEILSVPVVDSGLVVPCKRGAVAACFPVGWYTVSVWSAAGDVIADALGWAVDKWTTAVVAVWHEIVSLVWAGVSKWYLLCERAIFGVFGVRLSEVVEALFVGFVAGTLAFSLTRSAYLAAVYAVLVVLAGEIISHSRSHSSAAMENNARSSTGAASHEEIVRTLRRRFSAVDPAPKAIEIVMYADERYISYEETEPGRYTCRLYVADMVYSAEGPSKNLARLAAAEKFCTDAALTFTPSRRLAPERADGNADWYNSFRNYVRDHDLDVTVEDVVSYRNRSECHTVTILGYYPAPVSGHGDTYYLAMTDALRGQPTPYPAKAGEKGL